MLNHYDLIHTYNLQAPSNGGTSEMNLKTNYADDVIINNYYINKDIKRGPVEYFSIYSTGLVIFLHQTPTEIQIHSNMEFQLNDDGEFILIS